MAAVWPPPRRSGISRGVTDLAPLPDTPLAAGALRLHAPAGGGALQSDGDGVLFLGVDLGKVTTAMAVGERSAGGELRILLTCAERHLGDPLRPFLDL